MSKNHIPFDVSNCKQAVRHDPDRLELHFEINRGTSIETVTVATLTKGCYSVTLWGPPRNFWEPNAPTISHSIWLRTLPEPFSGSIDFNWLVFALEANFQGADDVLAIAMQYLKNSPTIRNGNMKIAGHASYGPLEADGRLTEGSDFNDYLSIPWHYAKSGKTDLPESLQANCLDCSGYMRMVWGFRSHLPHSVFKTGVPLTDAEDGGYTAMPRRAVQMAVSAPGVLLAPQTQASPPGKTVLEKMQPGDLVFFNVDKGDDELASPIPEKLDHVGMYLGKDTDGGMRFIHSPKKANGPTFGDKPNHRSLLDEKNGFYHHRLRLVRRL